MRSGCTIWDGLTSCKGLPWWDKLAKFCHHWPSGLSDVHLINQAECPTALATCKRRVSCCLADNGWVGPHLTRCTFIPQSLPTGWKKSGVIPLLEEESGHEGGSDLEGVLFLGLNAGFITGAHTHTYDASTRICVLTTFCFACDAQASSHT